MKELFIWWNHLPEHISPVFLKIGFFQVHYYGLAYLLGFLTVYLLVLYRLKTENFGFRKEDIENYFFWLVFAVLVGGRFGYVLFYDLPYYLQHPLEIILPFDINNGFQYTGLYGMSYHGALIAIIITTVIFCRRHKLDLWRLSDLLSPAVPLGYTFGRIGNFINGELYGRVTSVPWGMYFPLDPTGQLRHPSQLYEAFFEGVLLFIILWSLRKKIRISGCLFSLYLIGYGAVRFLLEFFRQPDRQLGFVFGPFTMGQVLCFAMILSGSVILIVRLAILQRKPPPKSLSRSFTLTELIVVIIIVGILAALGISQYSVTVEKSRLAEAKIRLGAMRQLAHEYWLNNGTLSTLTDSDVGTDNTCVSTSFYKYHVGWLGATYVGLLASRCASGSGGKTPNATREYRFSLWYYPGTGQISWHCYYPDEGYGSPCFGFTSLP